MWCKFHFAVIQIPIDRSLYFCTRHADCTVVACSNQLYWYIHKAWSNCITNVPSNCNSWWRHQIKTFSALLVICAGEFPAQGPVTRSFDVFFDLRLNKRLSKQSWAGDLRRHRAHYDVIVMYNGKCVREMGSCTEMAHGTRCNHSAMN